MLRSWKAVWLHGRMSAKSKIVKGIVKGLFSVRWINAGGLGGIFENDG